MASEANNGGKEYQKSYFDVLGICCTSEVPLVEKILGSLDGVKKVSVIVPSKTVIVVHDTHLISQHQIVKALNQAKLEATIRNYGNGTTFNSWPSKYTMACSLLLALSLLGLVYEPLHWLALAAIAVGIPPMVIRSTASLRRLNVDIDILMLIAVAGSIALKDYWEGGVIVLLFSLSEWLNSRATQKDGWRWRWRSPSADDGRSNSEIGGMAMEITWWSARGRSEDRVDHLVGLRRRWGSPSVVREGASVRGGDRGDARQPQWRTWIGDVHRPQRPRLR